MPTSQDETLQQRCARDHQDYLKLCGSMNAEQVADLQLQLNNALGRETALRGELRHGNAALEEAFKDLQSYRQNYVTRLAYDSVRNEL